MSVPRAAILQGGSNGGDEPLVLEARRTRPNRKWWWGVRRWAVIETNIDESESSVMTGIPHMAGWRTGAWCYICNTPMATWSSRWPVPAHARLAIREHRTEHLQGRLDTPPAEDKR